MIMMSSKQETVPLKARKEKTLIYGQINLFNSSEYNKFLLTNGHLYCAEHNFGTVSCWHGTSPATLVRQACVTQQGQTRCWVTPGSSSTKTTRSETFHAVNGDRHAASTSPKGNAPPNTRDVVAGGHLGSFCIERASTKNEPDRQQCKTVS